MARRLGWLFGMLAVFAIGWWAGSYTSCSNSQSGCEARMTAIDTVGTWVGGIGTIVALVLTMRAFQREQSERESARAMELAARGAAEQEVHDQAQLVTLATKVGGYWGGDQSDRYPMGLRIVVSNGATETAAFFIGCEHEQFGKVRFDNPNKLEAAQAMNGFIDFHLPGQSGGGVASPLTPEPEAWGLEQTERMTLTFLMNDCRWRRHGSGPAVQLGA